jgi:hypothetical protein
MVVRLLTILTARDFFAFAFCVLIVLGAAEAVLCLYAGFATLWLLLIARMLITGPRAPRVSPAPATD